MDFIRVTTEKMNAAAVDSDSNSQNGAQAGDSADTALDGASVTDAMHLKDCDSLETDGVDGVLLADTDVCSPRADDGCPSVDPMQCKDRVPPEANDSVIFEEAVHLKDCAEALHSQEDDQDLDSVLLADTDVCSPRADDVCPSVDPTEASDSVIFEEAMHLKDCAEAVHSQEDDQDLVRLYEQRLENLKNECHQAWMSVDDAYRKADKLREELACKSLTVDTLANVVEGQEFELRDLRSKEESDKQNLRRLVVDLHHQIQDLKSIQSILSKEAKECICALPDPEGMISSVQALVNEQQELKKRYFEESQERKYLYNKVIELRGNVRVFCRCRPLSNGDAVGVAEFDAAKDNELVIRSGSSNAKKLFKFDRVFTPDDGQSEVFADTSPVVVSVLDGFNVCIFAYGQTGTGKTFTMEGSEDNRGVNYRTLEELFRIATQRKGEVNYEICVSVLEVYNEQIRDLLSPLGTGTTTKKLEVKQVAEGGHHVPGVVEATVQSMSEVWEVLQSGSSARAVGATNVNEHSSRSHCLLCVKVKGENLTTGECTRSKLWLVDLAGSERVAKSDVHGDRLKEAQNINKSLSALGDVIHALTTKSSHVPYRNSKLTHLLQDSLGGDSKTLMFVQISPDEGDVAETLCSLNFASRVRGVEMGPAKKQLDSSEFFKYKQMAEKAKQETKCKEESVKKLEESVRNCDSKLKIKEQLCQSLMEKVRDRDKVAAELEMQLANEKRARVAAEAALKEKRRRRMTFKGEEEEEDERERASAEEALEAAFKTAAGNKNRQPLQERKQQQQEQWKSGGDENIDPQQQQMEGSDSLGKVGRMKMMMMMLPPRVNSNSNSPTVMMESGGGSRMRNHHHRRVQFSSPLMRTSREKGEVGMMLSSRMRRVSMVGRSSFSRLSGVGVVGVGVGVGGGGGAQRILRGKPSSMHQRERGWGKS